MRTFEIFLLAANGLLLRLKLADEDFLERPSPYPELTIQHYRK